MDVEEIFDQQPHLEHQNGRALQARYDRRHRRDTRYRAPRVKFVIGEKLRKVRDYVKEQCLETMERDEVYFWRHNDAGHQDNYRQEETVVVELSNNKREIEDMCSDWPYFVNCRYRPGRAFDSKYVIVMATYEYELRDFKLYELVEPWIRENFEMPNIVKV